jgi:hypothetical protein
VGKEEHQSGGPEPAAVVFKHFAAGVNIFL